MSGDIGSCPLTSFAALDSFTSTGHQFSQLLNGLNNKSLPSASYRAKYEYIQTYSVPPAKAYHPPPPPTTECTRSAFMLRNWRHGSLTQCPV